MHPNVHSNITYNSQDVEATQCPPTDEWIKMSLSLSLSLTHTHTQEYYSAIKRMKFFHHKSMDGPGECYETRQTEENKYCML